MRHIVSSLFIPFLFLSFLAAPSFPADEKVTQIGFEAYRRLADSRYWELVGDQAVEEAYSQLATGFLFLIHPSFGVDEGVTQRGIEVLEQLGEFYYLKLREYKATEEVYRHLVELVPSERDKGLYAYLVALALYRQRKYEEAIEVADKAISDYGYPVYNYYMKGFCYYSLGKYEESLEWHKKLVEEFPETGHANKARMQIGRVLYFLRRYQESVDVFKDLLSHNPDEKLAEEARQNIGDIERLFLKKKK